MSYFDPHEERRGNSPIYTDYMRRWEPTDRQWRWIEYVLVLAACALAWMMSGCSARSQEIAVVSAASMDVVSTEVALSRGGSEANPLMKDRTARVLGKAGATAITVLLARELEDSGHEKAASILRWSTFTLWTGAAAWNLAVAW